MQVIIQEKPTPTKTRIHSLDLLRGLVMVIMALDHTRDYFHVAHFSDPTDLATTTPALFFTRWITHFCAPVFVFLTGTSAFLAGSRRKNTSALAVFLLTRGLWLILLELTIINFSFWFDLTFSITILQVIWAIGISMLCLAALVYLPPAIILLVGLLLVCGHNLLDHLSFPQGSTLQFVWSLLHVQNIVALSEDHTLLIAYPVIPWIGLMALGYCFGSLYGNTFPAERRKSLLWQLGVACIVLFIVLRATNWYGDLRPWTPQSTALFTFLSFLNTTKYPPSLLYLLMTMGPALLLLYVTENKTNPSFKVLIVFGRVPLFYYILHFYLIHLFALTAALLSGYAWSDFDFRSDFGGVPNEFGYNLGRVYLVWICIVALLYPICKKYNQYKSRHHSPWLSYL